MTRRGLDRNLIIAAARELVQREGLERLTMRALSKDLGVEAPSLYSHVRDKADLIAGLVDLVCLEAMVVPTEGDWLSKLRGLAYSLRHALLSNPTLAPAVAQGAVLSPSNIDATEQLIKQLADMGVPLEQGAYATNVIASFVVGQALIEINAERARDERIDRLRPVLATGDYPTISEVLTKRLDRQREFEFGLGVVLEGLRQQFEPSRERPPAPPEGSAARRAARPGVRPPLT
ncbi:MAG: TetR/AcrR family transcriptional regulator C-terminal domain-containing protein [Actinomycetota bacterium]